MKQILFVTALVVVACAYTPAFAQSLYSYNPYTTGTACTAFNRELTLGSRGSDVTQLQNFLVAQNYSGGGSWMVTGYFGKATAAAVRIYQQQHGLMQTGVVDTATRAALRQDTCAGASYDSNYSHYPYLYNYNYPYGYNDMYPYNYANNYYPNYNTCDVNYGYLGTSGWYQYNNCNNTNTNPSQIALTYLSPNNGGVGQVVTIYGRGFSATNNTVRFGVGIIANVGSVDGRAITFTVPTQLSGYGSQTVTLGTYNVSVTNAQGYTSTALPFTVTSLGASGQPVISNVSGPTSLNTGTNGVWTVQVYNPGSNYLSVGVNWGDQYLYAASAQPQTTYTQGTQTLTFSHTYYTTGTYTITFTATNANGVSTVTTATVYVTGGTTGYMPTISYITPTSGVIGTTVTMYGTNFSQSNNMIRFGTGTIYNVSSNGSVITFTVPGYITPCQPGYYCAQVAQQVTPGVYPIYVTNANGQTTNTLNFTVTQ